MHSGSARRRRGVSFWLLLVGATLLLSIEPALCLVILALGLSAAALTSSLLVVRLLLLDALAAHRARQLPESATRRDPMAQ